MTNIPASHVLIMAQPWANFFGGPSEDNSWEKISTFGGSSSTSECSHFFKAYRCVYCWAHPKTRSAKPTRPDTMGHMLLALVFFFFAGQWNIPKFYHVLDHHYYRRVIFHGQVRWTLLEGNPILISLIKGVSMSCSSLIETIPQKWCFLLSESTPKSAKLRSDLGEIWRNCTVS